MIETPRLLKENSIIKTPAFKFSLPKPYSEWQKTLMQTDVKFALFICGTKSGKTIAGACKIIHASYCAPAEQNGIYRIIAPTYALTKLTWDYISRFVPDKFQPHKSQTPAEYKAASEVWERIKPQRVGSKHKMVWPHNGAVIECVHAQDPEETIEGQRTMGNVMDECSKMREQVFASVMSTTTQTGGWIRAYSTPRGKNWVYHKHLECLNEMELAKRNNRAPTMLTMTARTIDNPYVPRESIEQAKQMLPDRIFRQLYMAEFVEDGSFFSGYRALISGPQIDIHERVQLYSVPDADTRTVILGGDWARTQDYTVVTAWDTTTREMVGFLRFQGVAYKQMVKHVYEFGRKFSRVDMLKHDRTGIGDVIDELLQALPWPIEGIKFNNENKSAMANLLNVDMEHGKMRLLNWPEMLVELDAYEVTVSQIGTMKFGAPPGMHDDIVTSMMLGYSAVVESNPDGWDIRFLDSLKVDSVSSYYDNLMDDDD